MPLWFLSSTCIKALCRRSVLTCVVTQRAFRQRKEGYIKKLEEQVRDYALLNENYKAVQAENYQLRDYIINLQSRLIESQGDFPQPPSNIDLPHPRTTDSSNDLKTLPPPAATSTTSGMDMSAISQLRASAAQAVADLGPGASKHQHEEAAYLATTGREDLHVAKRSRNNDANDDGMSIRSIISRAPSSFILGHREGRSSIGSREPPKAIPFPKLAA